MSKKCGNKIFCPKRRKQFTLQCKHSTYVGTFQPPEICEASWPCISPKWVPQVTTKYFVTTFFGHNLNASAIMLTLQVLENNVDPEKNKTKHTYRIFIQTYSFSVNVPILIPALKVFSQPSNTQILQLCWRQC